MNVCYGGNKKVWIRKRGDGDESNDERGLRYPLASTEAFIKFQYQVCLSDCKVTLNNVHSKPVGDA